MIQVAGNREQVGARGAQPSNWFVSFKKKRVLPVICYLLIVTCYLILGCDNVYMYRDLDPLYWGRESNFFTVAFNSMGGSKVESQSIQRDEPAEKPEDPVYDNYGFVAWYKNITYTSIWDFDTDIVTQNITLYAKWDIDKYTITFDSNGGDTEANPASITADHYSLIIPPLVEPARTGFGFGGWYKEPECINKWDFAADNITGHLTLYAFWIENTIIVTLDIEQIKKEEPIFDYFTISRNANGNLERTATVSVNEAMYDIGSIKWFIAGVGAYAGQTITGTGGQFILDAADTRYNSPGNHILSLEVKINGITYQTSIYFTIVN